ncbi:MAG: HD domain-containing protein [Acholeplasmataceae bacterium]
MSLNTLKKQQVYKDPLYGFIHVDDALIKDLIDSAPFQRLRRIRQLSGVHMVFHGAEHSRFSHSLGVYEIAYRFSNAPDLKQEFTERERLILLVSALLHDIGHGAYSHAFEDVFGIDHEAVGARIIKENPELLRILNRVDDGFAFDVASVLLKEGKYPLIEQLISSQLDADRLDYLERDAYFTGAAYGRIDADRIIRVARIKDGRLVFKVSGIHAIENYLISRYHMYWQVYFHPVSRAYELTLEKIYQRVRDLLVSGVLFSNGNLDLLKRMIAHPDDLDDFMALDDYYMNGLIAGFRASDDEILRNLARDFLDRKIWGHLRDDPENQDEIARIKASFQPEEQPYYTGYRTVENSTYRDDGLTFGEKIYLLLEDGSVSTITERSAIIDSLRASGAKRDPRFFYRK